jgi:hypothetical protein
MTGKWSQPDVPHKGWECVGIDDLEEPSAICEMCEAQEIRFVHHMEHPEYPGTLACGCICAGNMEENYDAARNRESGLRNLASRRTRWLSRCWRTSRSDNAYLNVDGYNVVVFQTGDRWSFLIRDMETGKSVKARKTYDTETSAMLRTFDAVLWAKQHAKAFA